MANDVKGMPSATSASLNGAAEYERLRELGVTFTQEPTELGPVVTAVLDDSCAT